MDFLFNGGASDSPRLTQGEGRRLLHQTINAIPTHCVGGGEVLEWTALKTETTKLIDNKIVNGVQPCTKICDPYLTSPTWGRNKRRG